MAPSSGRPNQEEMDPVVEQKKKARRMRRRIRNKLPEAGELNITAMMDILTIILVFLLKNYNTDPAANLTKDLRPPVSTSDLPIKEAITVTITRKDISVDDKKVLDLVDGRVPESYLNVAGQPLLIGALRDALLSRVEHHRQLEARGGVPFTGNMLLVGDRKLDYRLISQVLYSAGQAQLSNFKFVTLTQQ